MQDYEVIKKLEEAAKRNMNEDGFPNIADTVIDVLHADPEYMKLLGIELSDVRDTMDLDEGVEDDDIMIFTLLFLAKMVCTDLWVWLNKHGYSSGDIMDMLQLATSEFENE